MTPVAESRAMPSPSLAALDYSRRVAGVLTPVFALRSNDRGADLGCGDTRAAREFIDWAADAGLRVVQFLPIHATGEDHSPYRPVSARALDLSTVCCDPAELPDVPADAWESARAEAQLLARDEEGVNYPAIKAARERLLAAAHDRFAAHAEPARREAFAAFQREAAGWLDDYTLHHAFTARQGGEEAHESSPGRVVPPLAEIRPWLHAIPAEERMEFERDRAACAYAQWVAREQWLGVRRHAEARGVALMGDLPFGLSFHAADVAARPELFERTWSGGAPVDPVFKPDEFARQWGQNWGVPPYDWAALERDGLAWWRERVAGLAEIFHVVRLDHILGFYRMFAFPWRPEDNEKFAGLEPAEIARRLDGRMPRYLPRDDATPERRRENLFRGHAILEALQVAAGRTRLVAEDIGHVPAYVKPDLASLGMPGFILPASRRQPGGRLLPGTEYPRESVAMWGTHDNAPLAAWWADWAAADAGDEAIRRRLKDAGESDERDLFAEFAGVPKGERDGPWNDRLHEQLVEGLLASNSWLAVLTMADLLGTPDRINTPGLSTSGAWSQRLPRTAVEMRRDPAVSAKVSHFREVLRRTGRT